MNYAGDLRIVEGRSLLDGMNGLRFRVVRDAVGLEQFHAKVSRCVVAFFEKESDGKKYGPKSKLTSERSHFVTSLLVQRSNQESTPKSKRPRLLKF